MTFLPQAQQVSNVFPLGLSISKTAAGLSALFPSTALQFHCFGSPRRQNFSKLSEKLRQCHIYAKPQKLTLIDALCGAGEVFRRQFLLNSKKSHLPHLPNQVRAFQMFEDVASSCCKNHWLQSKECSLTALWRWPILGMCEFLIEGHPAPIPPSWRTAESDERHLWSVWEAGKQVPAPVDKTHVFLWHFVCP